jgi:hypothetical protein
MARLPESTLKTIGLRAAQSVVGDGKVDEVEIASGPDSSDRPAHFFSFLIEPGRDQQRAALVHTRLVQKIRDELVRLGDGRYPIVRILSRDDWEKRERA